MRAMLRPLVSRDHENAYRFLTAHGMRDVFLAGKVHEGALTLPDGSAQGRLLGAFDGERLEGVLFLGHGGLVVFSADAPHVRRQFAEETWRERARVRLVVGEWDAVTDFWGHLEAAGLGARRDWREVFCEVSAKTVSPEREPALRLAEPADLPELTDVSARAYLEETGEDPIAAMGDGYVRHVARNVEERRTYVLRDQGRIVFKAELSARAPIGAQIVGVFTEPDRRGEGLARRGTGEMVHRLLETYPAVCLFVREDNTSARRAYERAGFAASMFYRRLFVDPPRAAVRAGAGAAAGARGVAAPTAARTSARPRGTRSKPS
jgi:ribosomal protein S18 acetylase RimI-like enzyme